MSNVPVSVGQSARQPVRAVRTPLHRPAHDDDKDETCIPLSYFGQSTHHLLAVIP